MKRIALIVCVAVIFWFFGVVSQSAAQDADYKYKETKDVVGLVRDAAGIIMTKGEAAFPTFKKEGSPWRRGHTYIFVMDTEGNMVVHPDPAFEGKNHMDMKDFDGKQVTKGIIDATASDLNRNEGWFHYEWPDTGTIFATWKSAFAKRAVAPSGKVYVVASALEDPKMEEAFLMSAVDAAVALIEKEGTDAFSKLRDKSSQFIFLGTYIFVDTPEGIEVVNGGFPDVEGKNLFDYKDSNGKYLTREIIDTAMKKGSGWVDYLWPKPGQTQASKKHTYVKKAVYKDKSFAVGAGAYIKDESAPAQMMTEDMAGKLMILELKTGALAAGRVVRETADNIFIENMDGSMEVSFPRAKITKIRKPTDFEIQRINNDIAGAQKEAAASKAKN